MEFWVQTAMLDMPFETISCKGRVILVSILPKIATKNQNWKFDFSLTNLVKMKGVLRYVA